MIRKSGMNSSPPGIRYTNRIERASARRPGKRSRTRLYAASVAIAVVRIVLTIATATEFDRNRPNRHLLIAASYCASVNLVGKNWIAVPYIWSFSEIEERTIQ